MEETTNTTNGESDNNRWAWIVTVVVIVVVVAGFYMWPKEGSSPANAPEENQVVQQEEPDVTASALQQVSPSDEVTDIENDLNNTDLSGADKEMQDIESTVNAQ
mgnify:CR=1